MSWNHVRLFACWCLCGLCWAGKAQSKSESRILITNPGPAAFASAVVEIPWATVREACPQIDTARVRVIHLPAGKELPFQWEKRGEKSIQHLLVRVPVGAGETLQLVLRPGTPAKTAPLTYARYVPERFDDFAWENDRIAFRIYGAALGSRPDNAYGTDVWSKRTDQLVINKWYRQNDYHKDNGEGLDYYKVGLTLGAGDMGVFLHDSIAYIHNYRSWEILDNGPLRSTFRVKYDPCTFGGITVTMTKTISIDAGAQLSRTKVEIVHTAVGPLPVVAGIVLREEPGMLLLDEQKGILGYWEPRHGNDGTLGIGCVFPAAPVSMSRQYGHGLARLGVRSGDSVVYYTGAAWDKAGHLTTGEAWFRYLQQFAAGLKNPLTVSVVK
jgi:hypothetical protein